MISRALLNAPFFIPKDADLLRNRKVNTKKRQNRHLPELAFLILGTYFTAPFLILAHQMQRGEASGEMTKMTAIMGEEIEETGDFIVNEKDKFVTLTDDGVKKVENFFHIENLSDPENLEIQHNVILALRANYLMHRDKDYVVKDDEVLIVDEFTGRNYFL